MRYVRQMLTKCDLEFNYYRKQQSLLHKALGSTPNLKGLLKKPAAVVQSNLSYEVLYSEIKLSILRVS
jgi:hypothetical protein